MHAVFVACLLGGVAATALFLVLGFAGGAFGHLTHGAQVHGNAVHNVHGSSHGSPPHAPSGHDTTAIPAHSASGAHSSPQPSHTVHGLGASLGWTLSWVSPLSIAAALVWFGGVGLLTEGSIFSAVFAVLAAVAAAAIVRSVMNAFLRASVAPLSLRGEGAIGTVNATIPPGSTGEVIYTLEGLHRTAPARTQDGRMLPRGTEVVIIRREKGIAWVEPLDPLTEGPRTSTVLGTEIQPEGTMSSENR
jgi:membrane protein implicated in regulation of membrane protease activity